MQRYYDGGCLETGDTAIHNKGVAPAIKWLFEREYILPNQIIYDFGAGNGRNANWLRERGCTVYAYDPFNGDHTNYDCDGFDFKTQNGYSCVSAYPLNIATPIDVFLTSFVLNVLPKYLADGVTKLANLFISAPTQIHITRGNREIEECVRKQLHKGRNTKIWDWYQDIYEGTHQYPHVNPDEVTALCTFGVRTSRGFQRNTHLNESGFTRVVNTYGYAIDTK